MIKKKKERILNIENLKDEIVNILDSKKAIDLEVIPVQEKTILADYFIIASGTSNTQVKSLTDETIFEIEKRLDITPKRKEADTNTRWNLLDYLDVVVHIFHQEEENFINWKNCGMVQLLRMADT